MAVLAIISARSGSKGLKDKNIKEMAGHPLMYYSVIAAIESKVFDEVMVSTDSEKYAKIAKSCGASVPFLRSQEMSSDIATSWDMVEEVLDMYEKRGMFFDTVCLLQPTSPLRRSEDIVAAYNIYKEKDAMAVVAVCEAEHSPLMFGKIGDDGGLGHFVDRDAVRRRQDYDKYYRINGAIYFVDVKALREDHFLYGERSYAYVMPGERSVDIDNEIDFIIAEALMNYAK